MVTAIPLAFKERRTNRIKEKIIRALERILKEEIELPEEKKKWSIVLFRVINSDLSEEENIPFKQMFRELHCLLEHEHLQDKIRKIAYDIYRNSNIRDSLKHHNRRKRQWKH